MKGRYLYLAFLFVLAASLNAGPVFASVSDDQVTSQKIREADGTSGQNTNSGSGVKTGHLQNGAVTTSKMAVSSVTSSVIADEAVTDAKISGVISGVKLGTHTHNGGDILDNSLGASKLANGAVTNAKIGEPITVNNLGTYANVRIVHQGLADGVHTFNTIQAAINWIVANDAPSNASRKVISIMPGKYVENIVVPSFIHLKGSGRHNTTITGASADAAVITYPDGSMGSTGVLEDLAVKPAYAYFRAIEGYTQFLYIYDAQINGEVHLINACCFSSLITAESSYLMLVEEPRVRLNATRCYVEFNSSLIADAPDHNLVSSAITPRGFTPNTRITYCYSTGVPDAIPNQP